MQEKKGDESVSEEPTSVEASAPLNIYILPSTGRGIRPETLENALSERRQRIAESGPSWHQHKQAVSGLVVLGTSLSHSAPNSRRHTSIGSV